jgi:hypothetical protein
MVNRDIAVCAAARFRVDGKPGASIILGSLAALR